MHGIKTERKRLKPLWIALTLLVCIPLLIVLILEVAFLIVDKTSGSILSTGERRSYLLYVPASCDPHTPTPLVISLHGYAEWPAHQAYISRWNDLAEEEGFIVVYPSGTSFPKRWRTTGLTSTEDDPELDVRFISDLVDQLEATYNIDPARIYANGLSNGGGMSYLLACRLSDRIAAIGGVAGAYTYPPDLCSPTRPIPLIAFHGDADPVVPYLGGPSRSFNIPFPSVPEWMKGWADRNQCKAVSVLERQGDISGVAYSACDQNAEVTFYTIAGGGHSWPGGEPIPAWIVGLTSQDINATRVMWNFFKDHPISD